MMPPPSPVAMAIASTPVTANLRCTEKMAPLRPPRNTAARLMASGGATTAPTSAEGKKLMPVTLFLPVRPTSSGSGRSLAPSGLARRRAAAAAAALQVERREVRQHAVDLALDVDGVAVGQLAQHVGDGRVVVALVPLR